MVLHGIALHLMILHSPSCHCIVSYGVAWYCIVGFGAWAVSRKTPTYFIIIVIVIVIIIVVVVDTVDNIDDELRGKNGTRKHTKDCLRCSCLKMMMTTMAIKIMLMMVLVKVHFIHFKSSFEEILKIPPALYCKT